MKKHKF